MSDKTGAFALRGQRITVRDKTTGNLLPPGDTVVNFRGEPARLDLVSRLPEPDRSGKIVVTWPDGPQREYYDKVFDLEIEAA